MMNEAELLRYLRRRAESGDPRAAAELERMKPSSARLNAHAAPAEARTSALESQALAVILERGLPVPVQQHHFAAHLDRHFAFDLAWPAQKVALEVEGRVHRITNRFIRDTEKYNLAIHLGWRVFRAIRETLEMPDELIAQLKVALHQPEKQ